MYVPVVQKQLAYEIGVGTVLKTNESGRKERSIPLCVTCWHVVIEGHRRVEIMDYALKYFVPT